MLRQTQLTLKKGWTYHPGNANRGAKNPAWNPKISPRRLLNFFPLYMETPGKRPNVWHDLEFRRLGMVEWPKEVGFYNAGDNFELTPEMMYRLFTVNKNESFWSPQDNEKTIIHLMPVVEKKPEEGIKRVQEVFQSHIQRFGADHCIYNAVLQAFAFAKNIGHCKSLFNEMRGQGLDPNAQTFVNMMLASKLSGESREKVEEWFMMAVKEEALVPVVRLDTEFQMWWDQLERLGSFSSKDGFLSVNEEGATSKPSDMWATWGWDRKAERKFVSRKRTIQAEVLRRTNAGGHLFGTVYQSAKRRPWANFKGLSRSDWSGPQITRSLKDINRFAPAPEHNKVKAPLSY